MSREINRREFMKASAATGAVLMAGTLSSANAQDSNQSNFYRHNEGTSASEKEPVPHPCFQVSI